MAKKKIFSVGYIFPGGQVEQVSYDSDQTLLDADIVIFQPTIEPHTSYDEYQGKPLLTESTSFRAKEILGHWRAELKAAFDAGKVVFIMLTRPRQVFIHTGEKQYSGTGRNRQVTNTVTPLSSYSAIPVNLTVQPSSGTSVVLSDHASYLMTYWKEFGDASPYEVMLEGQIENILLKTKDGNRVVGAAILGKHGAIVLLPPVQYNLDHFTEYNEEKEEEYWTKEAVVFGKRLITAIVGVADAIQSGSSITAPPDWTQRSEFRLQKENELESAIIDKSKAIQLLQEEKLTLEHNLREAGSLRRLLYETGHQLEEAVLDALRQIGFVAKQFDDGKSEFDAIFTSPEGRFLGEVEGKDKQAVNIDKLSQLERNLQEDFAKEGVTAYAKGVLFGNPYRFTPIEQRATPFTEKCIAGAKRSDIALVFAPSLFAPAKYMMEHDNPEYARQCREAIFCCKGEVVTFPQPPVDIPPANKA